VKRPRFQPKEENAMLQQTRPDIIELQERSLRSHVEVRRVEATDAPRSSGTNTTQPHPVTAASRGLAQTFGLDIRAAALVVIVDLMVLGGSIASFGLLVWLELVAAVVLGFIVYRIQRHWYGDDHDSALTKSLIVGLVTVIPAPLTPVIAVPCGLLGLIQMARGGTRR